MSFRAMLVHRCDLYDIVTEDEDGSPITRTKKINTAPIPCRLDLNFLRSNKDHLWLASVSKPDDRTGVLFLLPDTKVQVGMRIVMTKGPKGTFQLRGSIDEAWDFDSLSHLEVGVAEVSTLQWREDRSQIPFQTDLVTSPLPTAPPVTGGDADG